MEHKIPNNVKCWIYFQGHARSFARLLRNKLNETINESICGIDEDFINIFSKAKTITDAVLESIKTIQNNKGIAIILFTKDFFIDGNKNDYNPVDELIFLVSNHKLENIKLFPIWYKINENEVDVPLNFIDIYNYVRNIPGYTKADEAKLSEITDILSTIIKISIIPPHTEKNTYQNIRHIIIMYAITNSNYEQKEL